MLIAGEGPAAERLKRQIPQARFLGLLEGHDLSWFYASLDIFVHTGADDTFCQAVQEAMASGVPVVAPAAGGPLDLVEDGHTGLLYAPNSVEELRAAVRVLAADGPLRARYGSHGRAAVAHRTWTAIGDELLGHYAAVLDGSGRSGAWAVP